MEAFVPENSHTGWTNVLKLWTSYRNSLFLRKDPPKLFTTNLLGYLSKSEWMKRCGDFPWFPVPFSLYLCVCVCDIKYFLLTRNSPSMVLHASRKSTWRKNIDKKKLIGIHKFLTNPQTNKMDEYAHCMAKWKLPLPHEKNICTVFFFLLLLSVILGIKLILPHLFDSMASECRFWGVEMVQPTSRWQ